MSNLHEIELALAQLRVDLLEEPQRLRLLEELRDTFDWRYPSGGQATLQ